MIRTRPATTSHTMPQRHSQRRDEFLSVWTAPFVMAALTLFGLLAALLGSGAWHWVAWLALAAPVLTAVRFTFWSRHS